MSTLAPPLPATSHVAWADLGLVLDDTHCGECGGSLTFVMGGGVEAALCGVCDRDQLEYLTEDLYE